MWGFFLCNETAWRMTRSSFQVLQDLAWRESIKTIRDIHIYKCTRCNGSFCSRKQWQKCEFNGWFKWAQMRRISHVLYAYTKGLAACKPFCIAFFSAFFAFVSIQLKCCSMNITNHNRTPEKVCIAMHFHCARYCMDWFVLFCVLLLLMLLLLLVLICSLFFLLCFHFTPFAFYAESFFLQFQQYNYTFVQNRIGFCFATMTTHL